jgi:arylsulfatase A-like enzyme
MIPEVNDHDHDDIPEAGRKMARTHDHKKVVAHGQWERAVQGYLASITFADRCVGRVLSALENSRHKDNTIIVLWSDHGWSLGEKHHWRKFALWEEPTRCVLIMAGHPDWQGNGVVQHPVNLLDIYPTLVAACGLPDQPKLEGVNLSPLLQQPGSAWDHASVTTQGPNNHGVRRHNWHYIRYADGSEELYNLKDDPNEWVNLAMDERYTDTLALLSKDLPRHNAAASPHSR